MTHVVLAKGAAGAGAHTWPGAQLPGADEVATQARATWPHDDGIVVAMPPIPGHAPPPATGAATMTLMAPMVVGSQLEVTVCGPAGVWQLLS
jgi:hypothetical protein